jgi:hypothetical protein
LVSADSPNVKFPGEEEKKDSEALTELRGWMKTAFGDRITEVKTANRLLTVPAVVVTMDGHMTIRMQRIMMEHNKGMGLFSRFALEINPEHAIIKRLDTLKDENSKLAELISHQILDNALHTEGLLQDPEQSTSRITHLLGQLIDVEIPYEEPEPVVKATPDFSKMAGLEGLQGLEGLEGLEGLGDNLKDSLAEAINNQTEEAPIDVTAEVADESADTKKEEKKEESTTA